MRIAAVRGHFDADELLHSLHGIKSMWTRMLKNEHPGSMLRAKKIVLLSGRGNGEFCTNKLLIHSQNDFAQNIMIVSEV